MTHHDHHHHKQQTEAAAAVRERIGARAASTGLRAPARAAALPFPGGKMPKLLNRVESGRSHAPRRVLIYGPGGVGKTTFASQSPHPIIIPTEDGLGEIDCHRFPLVTTCAEVMQALTELYAEQHDYQTVVVDSVDWLERLIWAEVCRTRGVQSVEEIGYGKGYSFALTQWREVIDGLSALRNQRSMTVVLIAHAKIERFENPETESYDRYVPRLHRLAAQLVTEWTDEVLFATYRIFTKQSDEGFNRKRTHGIGTGERILRTTDRPAHIAKNRLSLPDELPLDWNAYAEFIPTPQEGE